MWVHFIESVFHPSVVDVVCSNRPSWLGDYRTAFDRTFLDLWDAGFSPCISCPLGVLLDSVRRATKDLILFAVGVGDHFPGPTDPINAGPVAFLLHLDGEVVGDLFLNVDDALLVPGDLFNLHILIIP